MKTFTVWKRIISHLMSYHLDKRTIAILRASGQSRSKEVCVKLLPTPGLKIKIKRDFQYSFSFFPANITRFRLKSIIEKIRLKMSVRSAIAIRNVLFGKGLLPAFRPAFRPVIREPSVGIKSATLSRPTLRFYTTSGKHQTSKISSMASSPEIIQAAKAQPKPSKLRELTQKYGAVGVIVYLGVGVVDLGVTFGIIQLVGLDKVKALEKGVLDVVYSTGEKFGISKKPTLDNGSDVVLNEDDTPSFASVFILAYGIHKTLLLPIRLGVTAAITPAIVRKLHQLGWSRYLPKFLGISVPK